MSAAITVILNGESRQLPSSAVITDVIAQLDLQGKRYAVEINGEVMPRSTHAEHRLRAGDKIEVVQAIGGG